MRLCAPLVLCSLFSLAAYADGSAADRHAPSETGQLRSATVAAPTPARVADDGTVTREHDVAPAHAVSSTATDSDVLRELATRQLGKETKRHQRAVDACTASAHKRAPAAAGSLTLDLDIADRKIKSVRVTDDGLHDAELAACVTSVARTFSFSLAEAHVRWPITIH